MDSAYLRRIWSKQAIFAVLLILSALLACSPLAFAGSGGGNPDLTAQVKSWEFERWDSDITINKDGSYTVRETQVVNFTGSFSFLNRDLSTRGVKVTEGKAYGKVRYTDINVYSLDGKPYGDWKTESYSDGKRVRIGFSATNEQMGWIIEYRVSGAIIYAPEYDRFYFNVVSQERDVPIKASRTTVRFPDGTRTNQIDTAIYLDPSSPPASNTSGRDGDTFWWEVNGIPPSTTYTVDIAFPKGVVALPWQFSNWFGFLMIGLAVLIFTAALVVMLVMWWKTGRDVARPDLDVVRYLPPEGLKPAEVGLLIKEKPATSDISATIVDLAIKGKLSIFEEESGILKRKKYGFRKKSEDTSDLAGFEKELMRGLFETGPEVTEDDLEDKFYAHVGTIGTMVRDSVMKKELFAGDPVTVKSRYLYGGLFIALSSLIAVYVLNRYFEIGNTWYIIPGFVAAGLVVALVGRIMPRRSKKGSEAYSYAMGFKEYMATAEDTELEYMTPENFQANLPYAMVLGVSDKWAKKFEDIYVTPPAWFEGSYTTFSTVYLVGSLGGMTGRMNSTLTSQPSSSGGGGFGGGFSGGGFGGGGSSAG